MNSLLSFALIASVALTPETQAVLDNLKALPAQGKMIVSWTFPWDWHKNERDCPLEDAAGDLVKAGQVEREIGLSPILYFEDFYKVAGTYRSEDFYRRHRRTLGDAIRAAYAKWRSLPVLGWHPENPYVPTNMSARVHGDSSFYAWRYKSNGYPQEHRYVFREILDGTGGVCGLGRDTHVRVPDADVRPYATPREWYLARMGEIADFLKSLVDAEGRPIPVIIRLFHECEDDWSWWQSGSVERDEYVRLFRFTVDELRRRTGGGANLLFLYSPDRNWRTLGDSESKDDFLYRYPGDEYVDVIGYDDYSLGSPPKALRGKTRQEYGMALSEQFCESVRKMRLITAEAAKRGKACGLVETGIRNTVDDACGRFIARALTAPGVGFSFMNLWCYSTIPVNRPAAYEDWKAFMARGDVLTARDGVDLTKRWDRPPPARRWDGDPRMTLGVRLDLTGVAKPGYWDVREVMDIMAATGFKRLEMMLGSTNAFNEARMRDIAMNCIRYRHMDFGVSPDPYGLTTPPPSPDAARFVEWHGDTTEGLAGALRPELIRRYEAYSGVKLDLDEIVLEER